MEVLLYPSSSTAPRIFLLAAFLILPPWKKGEALEKWGGIQIVRKKKILSLVVQSMRAAYSVLLDKIHWNGGLNTIIMLLFFFQEKFIFAKVIKKFIFL